MAGPLQGVKVLDLTQYIAGPYATRLLGDYGADVIKLERPGGDPARRLPPFLDGDPHPEKSGTFFFYNSNKRSLVLDLKRAEGREVFGRLLAEADLVVESFRPGTLDRLGVGWEFVRAAKPSLPLVSITNFGQTGPYADYRGTDLTLFGFAGELFSQGVAEREPVKLYGSAALVQSGGAAAMAALAALMVGARQGIGQHVDLSIADTHLGGADRRHATVMGAEYSGLKSPRYPIGAQGLLAGVYPCADGYVELGSSDRLDRVADMLSHPEWLQDPKWQDPRLRANGPLIEEFNAHLLEWLMQRGKREVWAEARRAKVMCGPLFTVREIYEDPHFRGRGFWQKAEHPVLGEIEAPGRPFVMHDSPFELRRSAPLLGQHSEEVLDELGYAAARIRELAAQGVVGVR
ncbi:MAG: CoA transferase [Proteobacteria bacterium]|nr:CoA transferase [Pseudomonadota bacterium]